MSSPPDTPDTAAPAEPAPASVLAKPQANAFASQRTLLVVALLAVAGALGSLLLWQKLSAIQQQLARQSADAGAQASDARSASKQAQELALETAAKLAVTEARLAEATLQRTQLEDLMQSLSRSRDENLVVDIESSVRLALQQSQLTGSIQPLLAALKSADMRVSRAAQPRLNGLQRAIARDVARINAITLSDTASLLVKIDELVAMTDELPLANAVGPVAMAGAAAQRSASLEAGQREPAAAVSWWSHWGGVLLEEFRSLVRVNRIENPEAALLLPEQSFFLRENLKLRLLNARLGLLSRQVESARADLATAALAMERYFAAGSRRTQSAKALLKQVQGQMRSLEIPRIDETLTALATAAGGR